MPLRLGGLAAEGLAEGPVGGPAAEGLAEGLAAEGLAEGPAAEVAAEGVAAEGLGPASPPAAGGRDRQGSQPSSFFQLLAAAPAAPVGGRATSACAG